MHKPIVRRASPLIRPVEARSSHRCDSVSERTVTTVLSDSPTPPLRLNYSAVRAVSGLAFAVPAVFPDAKTVAKPCY